MNSAVTDSTMNDAGPRIKSIYLSHKKGSQREKCLSADLIKDFGIKGDAYAGHPSRQVSLLSDECSKNTASLSQKGLCTERFATNITFTGISLHNHDIGTRFTIGKCLLEITMTGKRCFPECSLVKKSQACCLKTEVVFAKVIAGGKIRSGDKINIQ